MSEKMWPQAVGLVKAAHFGPTVLVVGITFVLAVTQFSISDAAFIALAFLLGQLVVGWTNDLVDFPRDKAAMRFNKPLVAGNITELTLRISIAIALVGALIISLLSPLGIDGTAIHFLGLLSATAYNVKLKSTVFSVVPYIFSSGARPPTWIVLGFILFASAFHFLNVLKDLESDVAQQVMGLPQVMGRKKSIVTAALLAVLGIVDVVVANTVL
jgi:4-hydroxybenzoate polyprenyltransferase